MSLARDLFIPLADADVSTIVVRSLVMIVLIVAAFFGVIRLRRWLETDESPGDGVGFSISDLRRLHREGKISAEELERARAKMIGAAKQMTAKLPDPLDRGRKNPPKA